MANEPLDIGEDKSLLLVDDDEPFLKRLAKAMEKRGFSVEQAGSVAAGRAIATARHQLSQLWICGWKMAMVWMLSKCCARNVPIAGLWF